MTLPADSHVHSEWSWDAELGSMDRTCARAVDLGLPAVAFTEHVDHTAWVVAAGALAESEHLAALAAPDGQLTPPAFDPMGYLEAIDVCRKRYPELRIMTGMEIGEPHWYPERVAALLAAGHFERVLGSQHCLPIGDRFAEPPGLYERQPAAQVVRDYLAEVVRLIAGSDAFAVLAHIDYPTRSWPSTAGRFDPYAFEEEFRHALRTLAASGRALEINTRVPLAPEILGWWRDEGGRAVTFGSDAHDPVRLARGFTEAAALAGAYGFRPGRHPYDVWCRT